MNPYAFAGGIGRHNLPEIIAAGFVCNRDLLIARRYPVGARQHPDLQKFYRQVAVGVHFAVGYAGTGRHDLNIAVFNDTAVAHAVAVGQIAAQGYGNDFHIAVGVGSEALPAFYVIVVNDAQYAEAHTFGVVITGKTECVGAFQPAVVGKAARSGGVVYGLHIVFENQIGWNGNIYCFKTGRL